MLNRRKLLWTGAIAACAGAGAWYGLGARSGSYLQVVEEVPQHRGHEGPQQLPPPRAPRQAHGGVDALRPPPDLVQDLRDHPPGAELVEVVAVHVQALHLPTHMAAGPQAPVAHRGGRTEARRP